jgi:hypothetical protein
MPAGRPVRVTTVKADYLKSINSAVNLFRTIRPLCAFNYQSIRDKIHPKNALRVVGLSFLGMVASWERFVEAIFMRYLAGAKYPNNNAPPLRIGPCSNLSHAYEVYTGALGFNIEVEFLSFTKWPKVVKEARIYFTDGRPFSQVKTTQIQRLEDAFTLRNRVAHGSTKSVEDFKTIARQFRGLQQNAALESGYSVGALLLEKAARGFGQPLTKTYFEAYADMFRALADVLAP